MSIIYQSLTKLRSSAAGRRSMRPEAVKIRRMPASSDRIFTPRVLLLSALIFTAGIGGSYGVYKIQVDAPLGTADHSSSWPPTASYASTQQASASSGSDAGVVSPVVTAGKPVKKPIRDQSPAAENTQQVRSAVTAAEVVADADNAKSSVAAADANSGAALAGVAAQTIPLPTPKRKAGRSATSSAVDDVEHIRRANMRRSYDISRLVADIQRSMHDPDHSRTHQLLEQLAVVKGRNDPFVMKLQSYCYTRQGDIRRATAVLQEVLRRWPNDLEAGINMAILDIKAGRIRRADERLSRLREIYPEDTRIAELMEKLKS